MPSSSLSNKKVGIVIIGLLLAVGIGFAFVSSMNNNNKTSFKTVCDEGTVCVDLFEAGSSPSEIAVEVGKSVQFNAKGSSSTVYHLATKDEQGSLHHDHGSTEKEHISSGDFSGDEAWKVEFKETGSFQFVDEYNPAIEILVVVYDPNTKNTIE